MTATTPTEVTATELARSLSDILNRVRYRGESFIVKRKGEIVAVIGPPQATKARTWGEILTILGDWRMPGDGFADDIEAAQKAQGMTTLPEWPHS